MPEDEKTANKGKVKSLSKHVINKTLLVEVSWEACNQVGGIYTVLRSKAPTMVKKFGENYCLVGPHVHTNVSTEFDEITDSDHPIAQAVKKMRELGFDVKFGRWLVTGRPYLVLINPFSVFDKLGELK